MLTPDDRMWTIRRVMETGKSERIEGVVIAVEAAKVFCTVYDKMGEECRNRLASYTTGKALWFARAILEKE